MLRCMRRILEERELKVESCLPVADGKVESCLPVADGKVESSGEISQCDELKILTLYLDYYNFLHSPA